MERLLSSAEFASLVESHGRGQVKQALTEHLAEVRRVGGSFSIEQGLQATAARVTAASTSTLRRVVNATGILIHTNLGRSPIHPLVWREAEELVSGYANLEFDLDRGERGRRDDHLNAICSSLFGCEGAVLVNNNAAATLLLLAAVAPKREVIVSRGELVEIGGGFRVPEIIEQGGARLREVGTTNRTRAADYAGAVSRRSAALLRVHRSNFDMVGFTESPSTSELVELAHARRLPLLYDEGSGRVADLARYGFASGETIRALIDQGVDAVTCSTDKLIGAAQGGLVLGREAILSKVRKHPLMRALRAGKESYAILSATLRSFLRGRQEEEIALYRMLSTSVEQLQARAAALLEGSSHRLASCRSALGGGTTPAESMPSVCIEVSGPAEPAQQRMRGFDPPIIGRIEKERFILDLRTVLPEDLPHLQRALRA